MIVHFGGKARGSVAKIGGCSGEPLAKEVGVVDGGEDDEGDVGGGEKVVGEGAVAEAVEEAAVSDFAAAIGGDFLALVESSQGPEGELNSAKSGEEGEDGQLP